MDGVSGKVAVVTGGAKGIGAQVHAHTYYPPYLVHNSQELSLTGNKGGRSGATW